MNTEELNALKERAYKTAVAHGFHEEEKPDVYWLGLVMSEAGEAINADRKGLHADTKGFIHYMDATKFYFRKAFDSYIKDSVEDEIADIVIRLFDFAGLRGYKLMNKAEHSFASIGVVYTYTRNGLPGTLLQVIGILCFSLSRKTTERTISNVIGILSECFDKMKMRYNETRAMLNGKRY